MASPPFKNDPHSTFTPGGPVTIAQKLPVWGPSRSPCCSGLLWQGKAISPMLVLLAEAARVPMAAAAAAVLRCMSRGDARQAEPRRGSCCRATAGKHGAAVGRAEARPA